MAQLIHARKTNEGLRFRLWSGITDSYYTEEMTEQELREYMLKEAVCEAIENHLGHIEPRLQRAIANGTSSRLGDTRPLDGPWDENEQEP